MRDKLISTLFEYAFNVGTNVGTSLALGGHPIIGSLCLGFAGACLVSRAYADKHGEKQSQQAITSILRELEAKQGNLSKAILALAAESSVHECISRDQLSLIANLIRNESRDVKALIQENLQLVAYVGKWLQDWCEEQGLNLAELQTKLDRFVEEWRAGQEVLSAKIDAGQVANQRLHEETKSAVVAGNDQVLQRLEDIKQLLPRRNVMAEIDRAVKKMQAGKLEAALDSLESLWNDPPTPLSDVEKFRIRANIGHIYNRRDDNPRVVAETFLTACKHLPEDHERSLPVAALAYLLLGERDKAFEKACTALEKSTDKATAYAVWVQAAPVHEEASALFERVPAGLRGDSQINAGLAARAFSGGQLAIAEDHARRAIRSDAESPMTLELLGDVLLERERTAVRVESGTRPILSDPSRVQEAIALYSDALEKLGDSPRQIVVGRIRLKRGAAYYLLGDEEAAHRDVEAAYDRIPEDPGAAAKWALLQHDRQRDDDAIVTLRAALQARPSADGRVVLAQMLADRNKGDDRAEAEVVLRKVLAEPDTDSGETQLAMALLTLCRLLKVSSRINEAMSVLGSADAGRVPQAIRLAIESELEQARGNATQSRSLADAAFAAVTPNLSHSGRRLVALRLLAVKSIGNAFALWQELVTPVYVGDDTLRLLKVAEDAGEDAFILDFCGRLPDTAAFRIDFARFLRMQNRRDRRVMKAMIAGEPGKAIARRFGLSPGRVSPLRRRFERDWERFHGELATQAA